MGKDLDGVQGPTSAQEHGFHDADSGLDVNDMMRGTTPLPDVPLCVDCDGTLINTDLLHESVLRLVKRSLAQAFMLPFWLCKGKAYAKERLSQVVDLDPRWLPYNEPLLEWLRLENARGRTLVLATASPEKQAREIAEYLGIFDTVEATSGGINLKGEQKADRLTARFGDRGFDYAGNDSADVPVWKVARQAVVVNASSGTLKAAKTVAQVSRVFEPSAGTVLEHLKALRLHQWLKNVLVFLPLLAAHRLSDTSLLVDAVLAFIAFGLCASGVYVVNDLLDLPSDRAHVRKRTRPFASGRVSIVRGAMMVPALLAGAAVLASMLNPLYQLCLLGYFLLTTTYSLWLKNQVVVDVLLLAALYTSRVVAGAAATLVQPSFWLLAFSMFMFLSLAVVKRYSEMLVLLKRNVERAPGRGYSVNDLPVLMGLGTASGYCAVLVLALYVNSGDVGILYSHSPVLWLALPLVLYWISRMWMKTHRGEMHDDPVVFAACDWQSLVIAGLIAAILTVAT